MADSLQLILDLLQLQAGEQSCPRYSTNNAHYFYYSQKNESILSKGTAEIRVNLQRSRVVTLFAGFFKGA